MGRADYLSLGSWNVACSMCGRKRKSFEVVRNWQGMWRCPEHNEPRQPQDFVRGVQDVQTVPYAQPETDVFIAFCTPEGIADIVDYGIVDCMTVDLIPSGFIPS